MRERGAKYAGRRPHQAAVTAAVLVPAQPVGDDGLAVSSRPADARHRVERRSRADRVGHDRSSRSITTGSWSRSRRFRRKWKRRPARRGRSTGHRSSRSPASIPRRCRPPRRSGTGLPPLMRAPHGPARGPAAANRCASKPRRCAGGRSPFSSSAHGRSRGARPNPISGGVTAFLDHRLRAGPRHHRRRQRARAQEPARRTRRSTRRAGAGQRRRRPALGAVALSGPPLASRSACSASS